MPSGIKAAISPRVHAGGGARGECKGWSLGASRRNDLFLRSVDPVALDGVPFTLSLTLRDCPADHAEWERMRRALVERLRRMGMIRLHWLTEWQPRRRHRTGSVPHLHGMVMLSRDRVWDPVDQVFLPAAFVIKEAWLAIAKKFRARFKGQHVVPVTHVQGWFKYLSKHCARGVKHMQRDAANIPRGWLKTGRLWGTCGDWPTVTEERQMTDPAFFALRRFMRSYALSTARTALAVAGPTREARKRLTGLRRRLKRSCKRIARIVPVSDWCPPEIVTRWMAETLELRELVDRETGEVQWVWALPLPSSPAKNRPALETVQA